MRVTLAQLEAFYWVARLGSVEGAARQLNVAQPTVSLRLRDLQAAMEIRLFDRIGRHVRLSQKAAPLLEHAATVLNEIGKFQARAGADGEVTGVVRIGIPETFALVGLPALLQRLARTHPKLEAELLVATSFEIERAVAERALDVGFVVNPLGGPRLRLLPLGIQETSWVATPGWQLGPSVRPADLRQVPIITNPHPSTMHRQIMEWFRTAGLEPVRLAICNSVSVIARLVACEVAIGFLPLKMIEPELQAGRLVQLSSRPAMGEARVHAAMLANEHSGAVEAVLQEARHVLGTLDFLRPS